FRAPSPTPSPTPRSSPSASSTPTPTRSVTPSAPRSSYSVPSPTPASVASSPKPSPNPGPSASPRPTPAMPPSTSTYRQSTPPRSTPRAVGQNGERGIKNEERSTKHEDRKMPQRSNAPTLQRKGMTEVQLNIALDKAYKGGRERIRLADGRSLTVTLPPAMRSGQTIRVTAHEPSQDQLSLLIKVLHHEVFTLKLPDIYCQIPITPSEAVLGGGIDVLTLDGPVKMVLPAGVHSGQKLKLIGKGYPVEGKRGDQIVELQVQIPTSITAQEQELYEKLRRIESFRPRSNLAL
ncbi:MAG: DnaJ C-terminal domain-containing protein, partial [Leptolyngbyaceae bacterium]|nr:DnaJ C-terminal domain-containing protein [Leptolyngbyaceae bacterium]